MEYLVPFINITFACFILARWCAQFDQAGAFLGRNLPAGIKGSTISAIGSSMPELMSSVVLLFWYNDPAAFAIALGITAGSGVYNTAVIPPLAILFAKGKDGKPVENISLNWRFLARDVFWVVVTDVFLIGLVMYGYINVWAAALLNILYIGWCIHTYIQVKSAGQNEVEAYEEDPLEDYDDWFYNLANGNARDALFRDKPMTTWIAITLLVISVVVIAAGTHLLIEGVIGASSVLGIPDFISGLLLGAAASSLPDTILSVQDAKKGNFEDAIANPLASNTFDTSISIGLPLFIWLLWTGNDGIAIIGENMDALRISVVAMSASIGLTLLYRHSKVTKGVALFILSGYVSWFTWVLFTFV